jgi:hypothetical protein
MLKNLTGNSLTVKKIQRNLCEEREGKGSREPGIGNRPEAACRRSAVAGGFAMDRISALRTELFSLSLSHSLRRKRNVNETTTPTLSPQSTIPNPQSRSRTLVKSAILASVFAAGTGFGIQSASAGPVRFDNPAGVGHFDWAAPSGSNDNWLDITLPASAQPGAGASGLSSLKHEFNANSGFVVDEGASPLVNVAVNGYFLVGLSAGTDISDSLSWSSLGYTAYTGYGSYLPEGTPTYLGVRFDLGGGNQFGWIGVVRDGFQLDAFAWGYETEVGVAIAAGAGIPAPGGLALIALGALGITRRRRE